MGYKGEKSMQESFWIESRGYNMIGIMEYNEKCNKGENMVVLIHGFAGTKVEPHRMYRKLSKHLSNQGFTVIRFDFVGSGDSDGDFEEMTIGGEIQDSINVVNYCRKHFNVNKLFILGYSMGGCVAACTATQVQSDGLILWSPVSNPYWNFYHIFGKEKFYQGLKGENVDYLGDVVGKGFFEELLDIDPLRQGPNYSKPVCIIHGTEDNDVLPVNAYAYGKIFPNCSISFIDGADHCYSSKEWEESLLAKTCEFFANV